MTTKMNLTKIAMFCTAFGISSLAFGQNKGLQVGFETGYAFSAIYTQKLHQIQASGFKVGITPQYRINKKFSILLNANAEQRKIKEQFLFTNNNGQTSSKFLLSNYTFLSSNALLQANFGKKRIRYHFNAGPSLNIYGKKPIDVLTRSLGPFFENGQLINIVEKTPHLDYGLTSSFGISKDIIPKLNVACYLRGSVNGMSRSFETSNMNTNAASLIWLVSYKL